MSLLKKIQVVFGIIIMASLDDVLPDCDFDDCWSRNNPDRAYGDEGIVCTANGHEGAMERYWTAMGGDSYRFCACEVCFNNASFQRCNECAGCGVTMVVFGMQLGGREFCVDCMPMDTIIDVAEKRGLAPDCEWIELAYASHGEQYDVDEEEHQRLVSLMDGIEDDLARVHDAAVAEHNAELAAKKRKRVGRILALFPDLTEEQAEDIDVGGDLHGITVYEFLLRLRK